ncbi:MAG: hypothetical protein LBJ47_02620 [Tannerella sp.]|jgi:hypothetical protein|nr:hypothetical protein [Tannerella sp.]
MKHLLQAVFIWICAAGFPLAAQISEGGLPPSFAHGQELRSAPAPVEIPVDFRIADLMEDDRQRTRVGSPVRIARLIPVDYTMDSDARSVALPGGAVVRQLRLRADSAVAIMLYYDEFHIPPGGRLFIYSSDRTQLLGAYTHRTHPSGGPFATEFVAGNDLILEYVEAAAGDDRPRIRISDIGYAYDADLVQGIASGVSTRAQSGSCMVNVNCEEGEAWQNEKKGVCHTVQRVQNYSYLCSGALMNNTAEDFRPLILTARHCGCLDSDDECASERDFQQWMFYFHKELENCSSNSRPLEQRTMTGCRLLARTMMQGQSDGMLLELNAAIPDDYDVYYNGWDRRDFPAESGVGIHHPHGDFKKISTYTDVAGDGTFNAEDFQGERYAHWNVSFVETENGHSMMEGGSSGSPLFNENKLVVGTLTGGSSSCENLWGTNLYGKLSHHWDRYGTDAAMAPWLDPLNLGAETCRGRYRTGLHERPPRNLRVEDMGDPPGVHLSWDAPGGGETPLLYNVYRNNRKTGMETGLSYIDAGPAADRPAVYAVTAVYAGYRESEFAWGGIRVGAEHVDDVTVSIFPTKFSDRIYIREYGRVTRADIVSVSGRIWLAASHPAEGTLDTSALPAGFYFIRLYGAHGLLLKTFKAVKAK